MQPFFFCSKCGELDIGETRVEKRVQSGEVRGEEITVEMPLRVCALCGEVLSDVVLDDAALIAMYEKADVKQKSLSTL